MNGKNDGNYSTCETIASEFCEVIKQWEATVFNDREEGMKLAKKLAKLADKLARTVHGLALSIRGVNFLFLGDAPRAQGCLHEAILLQRENNPEKATTLRHLAFLRATEQCFDEAQLCVAQAIKIDEEYSLRERLGKDYLMSGVIEYLREQYSRAAQFFLESMEYLEHSSTDFKSAVHNFLCALIRCGDQRTVKELFPTIRAYHKQARDESTKNRTKWMLADAHLRAGNSRRAAQLLIEVEEYLCEKGGPEETTACRLDLAEALYKNGDSQGATKRLCSTRDHLWAVYGRTSQQSRNLDAAIKSRCKEFSPWEVRESIPLRS